MPYLRLQDIKVVLTDPVLPDTGTELTFKELTEYLRGPLQRWAAALVYQAIDRVYLAMKSLAEEQNERR